ncbi:MAG: hypothetical protein QM608_13170, partial [Caulobacter sp.]
MRHSTITAAAVVSAALPAAVLPAIVLPTAALAADPEVVAGKPDISWQDSLPRRTGRVVLSEGKASLELGPDFYFLDSAARRVLTEGWGNPPDDG